MDLQQLNFADSGIPFSIPELLMHCEAFFRVKDMSPVTVPLTTSRAPTSMALCKQGKFYNDFHP